MNEMIKKMLGSMNYNTYKNVSFLVDIFGYGMWVAGFIYFRENPYVNIFLNSSSMSIFATSIYLNKSYGYMYTKDIKKINELYGEFIKNYNKLNKVFDFKEPVSIYTMFNYLLYRGYLSSGKTFEFSENGVVDLELIIGANVISSNGVCRHISSMLTDILNDNKMNTVNLSCFVRELKDISVVENCDISNYLREKNIEFINRYISSVEEREKLLFVLDNFFSCGIYVSFIPVYKEIKNKKTFIKEIKCNHLICFTEYNGFNYYLDPTQGRLYRLNEDGYLYDYLDDKIYVTDKLSKRFNHFSRCYLKEMEDKSKMIGNYISIDEEKKIIDSTRLICDNNLDIFEKFYKENKDLYDEVASNLSNIKIRKLKK